MAEPAAGFAVGVGVAETADNEYDIVLAPEDGPSADALEAGNRELVLEEAALAFVLELQRVVSNAVAEACRGRAEPVVELARAVVAVYPIADTLWQRAIAFLGEYGGGLLRS